MELVATIVAGMLAAALLAAGLWLAFLLFLAIYSRWVEPTPLTPERLPSFLILVPAHNEEALIADTVGRILAIDYPRELIGLWVIADNCTDRTAEKAREAGANCLERNDDALRGKGYALDYALHRLAGEAGDAVLFLDADSRPDKDYLHVLARCYGRGDSVVQGCYETWSVRETWFTRLTAMSFALRNKRVYPALHRLGWPIPLRGSGMMFRRNLIERIGWSTHGLTEDLEMTLLLIRQNVRISFAPAARSAQYMPSLPSDAGKQRQRWSAGERSLRREILSREIPRAVKTGQWGRALALLYMAAPSLSVQLFFLMFATIVALPFSIPLAVCGLALLAANAGYVLSAAPAVNAASLSALGMIPAYAFWRGLQTVAARFIGRGWQRTERPGEKGRDNAMERPLKIVMLGIRGVPATYGGFETCVEEIGSRLAAAGHEVTVYCRSAHYQDHQPMCKGMRRVFLPCLRIRALETLSHTALSAWHALFRPADVFVAFNAANILALLPLRLRRAPLLINTDGQEWKRRKWGKFSRAFFKISERICTRVASRVITDGKAMAAYYRSEYGTETTTIAYGAKIRESVNPDPIRRFGVEPREYFLQVTRFEPENNPLLTVKSFLSLNTDKKLVLVGGVTYQGQYQKELQALAGDRVIMPGFIYDQDILRELWTNCLAYVHGNEVGGTNPALLQAMAYGCYVLSRDVVFNREPLGEHAQFYSLEPESLAGAMRYAIENKDKLDKDRAAVKEIIRERYTWELVAKQYEQLCRAAVDGTKLP